jgi:hypothetical protein
MKAKRSKPESESIFIDEQTQKTLDGRDNIDSTQSKKTNSVILFLGNWSFNTSQDTLSKLFRILSRLQHAVRRARQPFGQSRG